jgi:hypothetical protein
MWSNKAVALENTMHLHDINSSISMYPYANGLQASVTLNGRLQVLINEAKMTGVERIDCPGKL